MAVDLAPSAHFQRNDTALVLPVSFAIWARFDTTPAAYRVLLYHGTASYSNCLTLNLLPSMRISAEDGGFSTRAETDVLSTSTWYFIGVSVATGAGNFKLYWRAEGAASLSSDTGTWSGTFAQNRMFWGTGPGDVAASTHDGALAYARAWSSALTEAQLLAESAATADVVASWADWTMADAATSATDNSGNARNLTFNAGSGSRADFANPDINVGTSATATPAVIARSFALPAVTPRADSLVSPAVIARAFTLPAPGVGAGAGPAVIARAFTLPAVTATGGGSATATPDVIARTVGLPAVTALAGAVPAPAVIARSFVLPAVAASADTSATATPAVIARSFALPAVIASGVLDFAAIVALYGQLRRRHRTTGSLRARHLVKGTLVETKPLGSTESYDAPRLITPTDPTAQTIAFGFTVDRDEEPATFHLGTWDGAAVALDSGSYAGRPITPDIGPNGAVDLERGRWRVWLEYAGQVRRPIGTLTVT